MAPPQFWYVYVLRSLKDGKLYIGHTDNLRERLKVHARGDAKVTDPRRPLTLIFFEGYANKYDALRRERYFKSQAGKRTLHSMLREYFRTLKR